jgi:hypothetical protein
LFASMNEKDHTLVSVACCSPKVFVFVNRYKTDVQGKKKTELKSAVYQSELSKSRKTRKCMVDV